LRLIYQLYIVLSVGALDEQARYISTEYADDPRAFREESRAAEARANYAARLVRLLIAAVGGPFEQRRPTRDEYERLRVPLLYFAQRAREGWGGLRSRMVQNRLASLGLTLEQVQVAAGELGQ